uniref:piggyBac transposable element-derived protein 4-like n=1 Tax=Osmia lignaria TaxID=473952 RepID=UPI0014787727|nr:piggyBac transposable element-derived protein 4-like [Osmia lignaria]
MNRKRISMSVITNPCDHIIDDDDDYIVPVKRKRQRILSTSEDSDSDLSHQCPLNSLRVAEDVSNQRDFLDQNSRNIPWFRRMFSRNRFQQILKYFHLIDNPLCFPPGHEKYDPCAKFKPLLEHANKVSKLHYKPHKELSIDESLVGTLCHSSITQYLPNKKHHRWGIKFWMLCDSVSKYCLAFSCYKGAKETTTSDRKKFGLGYDVVVNLLKDSYCLNKGHHIFVDNFFTSVELARYLYSMDTYLTGTIRRNKKCIPDNLKQTNVNEVKYFRDNEVLFCAYREKKSVKNPVLLISTKADEQNVTITKNRHGREIRSTKPAIIQSYNAFMGGVDESDKMLYTYLDERRSVKYWKKVAFNIINRMVLNAYIIYKETVKSKAISRRRLKKAAYLAVGQSTCTVDDAGTSSSEMLRHSPVATDYSAIEEPSTSYELLPHSPLADDFSVIEEPSTSYEMLPYSPAANEFSTVEAYEENVEDIEAYEENVEDIEAYEENVKILNQI